jgi:hypothetical protein
MPQAVVNFGTGVILGGLALSACWGWLWAVIGTVGVARGVCSIRVVMNSLLVGISPLLLGGGVLWMRAETWSMDTAVAAGLLVMPLALVGLALRRASDGRRAGLHMAEGIRHLKDELLGTHHDCAGCGHPHATDASGRHS